MGVRPLHHVSISVRSLERSLRFYRDLLGMKPTLSAVVADETHERYLRLPTGTSGRAVMLQVGPPIGAIQLIEWSLITSSPAKRPCDPGAFVLAFELLGESIAEILARLAVQGVQPWTDPVTVDIAGYGVVTTVIIEDPDGIMIELLELPDSLRRLSNELRVLE